MDELPAFQFTPGSDSPVHRLFGSVFLVTLALLIWFSFQLGELFGEREKLIEATKRQEPLVQNAGKIRNAMDALAVGTYQLSAQGNGNARQLIEHLANRGITINPPKRDH